MAAVCTDPSPLRTKRQSSTEQQLPSIHAAMVERSWSLWAAEGSACSCTWREGVMGLSGRSESSLLCRLMRMHSSDHRHQRPVYSRPLASKHGSADLRWWWWCLFADRPRMPSLPYMHRHHHYGVVLLVMKTTVSTSSSGGGGTPYYLMRFMIAGQRASTPGSRCQQSSLVARPRNKSSSSTARTAVVS